MNTHKNIILPTFTALLFTLICFNLNAEKYGPNLTTQERKEVVTAVSTQLEDNYVFPDVAKKMAMKIRKQHKRGKYNKINDPILFASQLTEDLLSVSHDKHIGVTFNPEAIARQNQAVTDEENEELQQRQINQYKKSNFGFKELKILDGNVGYLDLRGFADTSYAGETASAAMNYLSHSDAIIFDLRKNGGGSPKMIQLLTSYLYTDEPVHLNNFYWRPADLNTQTWTLPYVPGKRSPQTPVYVLTSNYTFSAAEEFSYNLKNLKRATLVGETTGGGAHPGGTVNATDRFQLWVPSGRAINPITNTNWEGTGVEPHIAVKQEDALKIAHLKAIESLAETTTDEDSKKAYQWTLDTLKIKQNNVSIDPSKLALFVGKYGPRVITLEDNNLYYQRDSGKKYKLIPMSQSKFLIEELSYFRVEFEIEDSQVTAIIGHYDNGKTDKNNKS